MNVLEWEMQWDSRIKSKHKRRYTILDASLIKKERNCLNAIVDPGMFYNKCAFYSSHKHKRFSDA